MVVLTCFKLNFEVIIVTKNTKFPISIFVFPASLVTTNTYFYFWFLIKKCNVTFRYLYNLLSTRISYTHCITYFNTTFFKHSLSYITLVGLIPL